MKRIVYRIVIVIGVLLVLVKCVEWWLERNFEATINGNPERSYNITYSDFDLDTFFKGITLNEVNIEPVNKPEGSIIVGHVDYATIKGLLWRELFFGKRLDLREIAFENPRFEVTLSADSTKKGNGKGMQNLFGDILSRANVERFSIINGSVEIIEQNGNLKGSLKSLNIEASEISTDSLHWKHIIPFELGKLKMSIDDVNLNFNEYTNLSLGGFKYDLNKKEIILSNISLGYTVDWVEVSKRLGFQNDIIELKLKELAIHDLEPSSEFYTSLDISAKKISIDSLDIKLSRNKNIPRPPDVKQPMFNGIIGNIPVALKLDSLEISNSSLSYTELGINKDESGTIKISQINGLISQLTNIPEKQQEWGQMTASINSKLADSAPVNVDLTVPYSSETFNVNIEVGGMNLSTLNPTLKPLAGVEIKSGQMQRIHYTMNAGEYVTNNKLTFDYNDLHLNVIKKDAKHKVKKLAIKSLIANSAIRNNNIPGEKKYVTANYKFNRNRNRSPVNYIIKGLINGFTRIVPGKGIRKLIN